MPYWGDYKDYKMSATRSTRGNAQDINSTDKKIDELHSLISIMREELQSGFQEMRSV